MPEGPEVKRTVDNLRECFLNKSISTFKFTSGRYKKKNPIGYLDMCEDMPRFVTAVGCKGKFIYFLFGDGSSLWNTLGMSGRWSVDGGAHVRAVMTTTQKQRMLYLDTRNFGTFKFVNTYDELSKKLNSLGPDMLSDDVSFDCFKQSLTKNSRPSKTIGQLLMDQKVVSGIGNYLKAEILYDAKISPYRICSDISDIEMARILSSSLRLIRISYNLGGATLEGWSRHSAQKGVYNRRFAVYNQKLDPQGNKVVRETTPDNRTTHWVPSLQK